MKELNKKSQLSKIREMIVSRRIAILGCYPATPKHSESHGTFRLEITGLQTTVNRKYWNVFWHVSRDFNIDITERCTPKIDSRNSSNSNQCIVLPDESSEARNSFHCSQLTLNYP